MLPRFTRRLVRSSAVQTQPALVNNLFIAPLFQHEPSPNDFLLTVPKQGSGLVATDGSFDEFSSATQVPPAPGKPAPSPVRVVVQPFPKTLYTVGQTEPKQRVMHPNSKELRDFQEAFIAFQIAKEMERTRGDDEEEVRERAFFWRKERKATSPSREHSQALRS